MTWHHFTGLPKTETTWHNHEITQSSPDPFPHERVGSGHGTRADDAGINQNVQCGTCGSHFLAPLLAVMTVLVWLR